MLGPRGRSKLCGLLEEGGVRTHPRVDAGPLRGPAELGLVRVDMLSTGRGAGGEGEGGRVRMDEGRGEG